VLSSAQISHLSFAGALKRQDGDKAVALAKQAQDDIGVVVDTLATTNW
jgi:hypothetical protein